MKLSALVLSRNEEDMIEECLKQLKFVDEIIVLDQNSKDKTVSIAKKYTQKILRTNIEDFAKNRQLLAENAKGEWLIYVDSDERVTAENIHEIEAAIKNDNFSAYYFPRKNIILGKWLRHGGWWPDYVPRLIKKNKLIKWQGKVHESPKIEGEFGYFHNPISHLTARSINLMFAKSVRWAKIEADLFYQNNYPQVTVGKVTKAIWIEFISRYLIKRGFLDGTAGLIEGIYQSLHQAIILTYLWEIQNNSKSKITEYINE